MQNNRNASENTNPIPNKKSKQSKKQNTKKTGQNKQKTSKNANFTLRCNLVSAFTTPAGGVRQITIAPTLNLFNRAFQLAPQFQSYRIKQIGYKIMPRFNYSSLAGDLPLMLRVRLTSDDIPASLIT